MPNSNNNDMLSPETKRKILIVDDNEDIRTVISMSLDLLGLDVIECANGQNALLKFESEQPDIVILDQGLPDISGIEVGCQIRKSAGGRSVAMALFTGTDSQAIRDQATEAGFDKFLLKPLRMQTLSDWIETTE